MYPALEELIDPKTGSFWPGGSDCPDFDGAYMMMNLAELTDYRKEDLRKAARAYLQHALMHEDPNGCVFTLHRKGSKPSEWKPRPHFICQFKKKHHHVPDYHFLSPGNGWGTDVKQSKGLAAVC